MMRLEISAWISSLRIKMVVPSYFFLQTFITIDDKKMYVNLYQWLISSGNSCNIHVFAYYHPMWKLFHFNLRLFCTILKFFCWRQTTGCTFWNLRFQMPDYKWRTKSSENCEQDWITLDKTEDLISKQTEDKKKSFSRPKKSPFSISLLSFVASTAVRPLGQLSKDIRHTSLTL